MKTIGVDCSAATYIEGVGYAREAAQKKIKMDVHFMMPASRRKPNMSPGGKLFKNKIIRRKKRLKKI